MPPKKPGGPADAKKMAPNTMYCTSCPFKSPDRQKVREHLMKKHGFTKKQAEAEV